MLLFAPGPIRIPNVIQKALVEEVPYFASKDFTRLFREVQGLLKEVFRTKNLVMIGNGSGSLGMEVAVNSSFGYGDDVAVIVSGKYGENWCNMCRIRGLKVTKLGSPYSSRFCSLLDFENFCYCRAKDMKGIFVTHFETTSGILHPIEEYLRIYRKHGGTGLFIVDAISSLLTEPLRSENYDIVIGASQKALSLPPGLFFITVSDKVLNIAKGRYTIPLYYFNLLREYEYQIKGISVFTTSVNLINALRTSLNVVLRLGVDKVIEKSRCDSLMVRYGLRGFSRYPVDGGNAVSVFDFDLAPQLVKNCYDRGLILGSGIRKLKNNTFRVMSFGWDLLDSEIGNACKIVNEEAEKLLE